MGWRACWRCWVFLSASISHEPFVYLVYPHKTQPTPHFRCKRLVASFEAEQERLQQRLERSIKEEPAKLLSSCDDVTRLCRVRKWCGATVLIPIFLNFNGDSHIVPHWVSQ